jgi:hypothetical protein
VVFETGVAMHKIKIIVRLPDDRDYAGQICIENSAGQRLAGPFPVCGRADDKLARENQNPGRDPLLPFGDLPLGEYQLRQIIGSGTGTPYPGGEFGAAGIILLQPKAGDAALADANGRFGFFIQGGALSRDGRLRPTDGSLRLSNRHQRKLINVLRRGNGVDCQCWVLDAGSVKTGRKVAATVMPGLLAQGKALLSGLLGAGSLEASHRSLLKKMLLAGRISMSIPSLIMLSTHAAFSQNPADREGGNLLFASRDAASSPVLFADATDTGASHDYAGQLPDTTHANQDANAVSDNSHQAANDANLEQAKHDSGVGFDTPAIPRSSTTTPGTSTPGPVSPSGAEPLNIPAAMAQDPDVQNLNKYEDQLKQDQEAAQKAQADYDQKKQADPTANMADLLNAQARLKGTENMVKYESDQVKRKLPALPATPAPEPPQKPTAPPNSQ